MPAILEAIPYRLSRRQAHATRASTRTVAGHGYACVRLDLRGTGESDGLITDEYTAQEHTDACEVIAVARRAALVRRATSA